MIIRSMITIIPSTNSTRRIHNFILRTRARQLPDWFERMRSKPSAKKCFFMTRKENKACVSVKQRRELCIWIASKKDERRKEKDKNEKSTCIYCWNKMNLVSFSWKVLLMECQGSNLTSGFCFHFILLLNKINLLNFLN